ncbi:MULTISPECIES: ATP-binding protein [unclassified Streptomyces]|uniref:AAA family ATPase n=1 Tax=unclassified Streptomyces TaxID=2593676 RepID=UPI002251C313|nr:MULTISPECIES: ATP-binding protein [unclassified Streptomyces]WTB52064.1 ATP-binding protein [Streptomyces sp. NBC_00826]WTH95046.1 ATP-binding protein [Streptomyces sp. NBC_00825]WTI03780.1 ATP-binding protein [Streptomyces sp. NBC_00822]MCX4869359.1 ATP-binding protein [Streptomyces sp. NBC_00906]MCX4900598.1 ATP-binding protein [Streptomyces sp. NBC_00892]
MGETGRPSWPAFDGVEILTRVGNVAFVVVSGLPGSGKSTLARSLARRLSLPVIDKDVILESLYDSLGVGDHPWRSRLSRASDDIMFALAADAGRAVLDNWWHHDTAPDRLRSLAGLLIEVHCDCDVALAAERFQARTRHPGHLDPQLTPQQFAERVAAVRATYPGPLNLGGPLLTVDTSRPADVAEIAEKIAYTLGTNRDEQTTLPWKPRIGPDALMNGSRSLRWTPWSQAERMRS